MVSHSSKRHRRINVKVLALIIFVFAGIILYDITFKLAVTVSFVLPNAGKKYFDSTDLSPATMEQYNGPVSILFYTSYINVSINIAYENCLVYTAMFNSLFYNNEKYRDKETNYAVKHHKGKQKILKRMSTDTNEQTIKEQDFQARRTYMLEVLQNHHIVVFHARDMPRAKLMKEVYKYRPNKQIWAYYNKESPYNTPNLGTGKYDHLFKIVITPLRNSDVFAPYGTYLTKSRENTDVKNTPNWFTIPKDEDILFSRKRQDSLKQRLFDQRRLSSMNVSFEEKDLVAWVASNCKELRDKYVLLLRKYIPVHIYGYCGKRFDGENDQRECEKDSFECEAKLRSYKFVLSFENSFCDDYISEKYWNALVRGNVPIVLGGNNYDSKLVIPGSFINLRDFKTAKELATYIKHLGNNKIEYDQYFNWRMSNVLDFKPNNHHRIEKIVQKLHDVYKEKTYNKKTCKLSNFYSLKKNCPLHVNDTFWKSFSKVS